MVLRDRESNHGPSALSTTPRRRSSLLCEHYFGCIGIALERGNVKLRPDYISKHGALTVGRFCYRPPIPVCGVQPYNGNIRLFSTRMLLWGKTRFLRDLSIEIWEFIKQCHFLFTNCLSQIRFIETFSFKQNHSLIRSDFSILDIDSEGVRGRGVPLVSVYAEDSRVQFIRDLGLHGERRVLVISMLPLFS